MASQTRNRVPRPAVYRKRHKALQHLTDANTNHGFGQRIVIQDMGHNPNGDSCFGISGPSGVQMFQPVNPGNYREAATRKEPKCQQMPVRQTGNQIEPRSGRYRKRMASSTSPPIHIEELQTIGHRDPGREPNQLGDGVTATIQMPAVDTVHASRQYADTPCYLMQTPFDESTFTSGHAGMAHTSWSQCQSQSPVSSDYSDLSDTPDASWQDLDPQRFGRVSANIPYSGVGPTTIDVGGHVNNFMANNDVDHGKFQILTDGLGLPAYPQVNLLGDPSLQWGESVVHGAVSNYSDSQIYDRYKWSLAEENDYDFHGSSVHYSRDSHNERQTFLTYQYPATDYN